MKLFTPIINFDFDKQVKWIKISKLKIKKISSKDLVDYFGLVVVRDKNYNPVRVTSYKDPPTPQFRRYQSPSLMNEFQNWELLRCKYAFVSYLKHEEHGKKVYHTLNAFRLYKLNGITCPATFDKEISMFFTYPIESKIKGISIFTKNEIKEIEQFLPTLLKIDAEDLKLLTNVMENGISILSIVFLMIIIERTLLKGLRGEISFKVKFFAARYLSKYYKYKQNEVFKKVQSAYDLRSSFVHGRQKIKKDQIEKIFPDIYDYTIKLLRLKAKSPYLFDDQKRNSLVF